MLINSINFIYNTFLLPPGIFIIILIWLSVKLYKKNPNNFFILMGITSIFYLSTTALFSYILLHPLENTYRPPKRVTGDVIIVLGGGATLDTPNVNGKGHLSGAAANRLLTCLQLYEKLKLPIILSGGQVYKTTGQEAKIAKITLLGVGIPPNQIIIENKSMNTTENARYTKELLVEYKYHQPILVTSAFHMPRAVRQFTKIGVKVTPYPTDYLTNVSNQFEFQKLIPTSDSLMQVKIAIKEYLGIMVARWY